VVDRLPTHVLKPATSHARAESARGTDNRPWLSWARLGRAVSARGDQLILVLMVAGACALHTYSLGHSVITQWDESFHAVVAEHVALHPLVPTLYEVAALTSPTSHDWGNTHVWLHIPIFGFWGAALSLKLFGDSLFALRLPGVLYIGLGMSVVFSLGRKLYGPGAGLVSAAFLGFAPYVVFESQGYVFGDLTDMPLLLFTPLAMLCLLMAYRSGRWRWLIFAGIAAGICYLTKAALGWAPIAVAGALYGFELIWPNEEGWRRLGIGGPLLFLTTFAAVAAPFNIYTAIAFPQIAAFERGNWQAALLTNFETWGHPPDTHFTAYLYGVFGPALALLLLIAVTALAAVGIKRRSRTDLLPVLWIFALYIPLSIAISKAPAYTIAALPAFGLAAARSGQLALSSRSAVWRTVALSVLCGASAVATVTLLVPLRTISPAFIRWPYPHWWPYVDWWPRTFVIVPTDLGARLMPLALDAGVAAVIWCVGAGAWRIFRSPLGVRTANVLWRFPLAAGISASPTMPLSLSRHLSPAGEPTKGRRFTKALVALCVFALGAYWLSFDVGVVRSTPRDPGTLPALGATLAKLTPPNATIILNDDLDWRDNVQMLMFWSHRDVYSYPRASMGEICSLASVTSAIGSPLFVVSMHPAPGMRYQSVRNWAIFAPDCPRASYEAVLKQLRTVGSDTAHLPGVSSIDFGVSLNWQGSDPRNDVSQASQTVWGVNVGAMLIHPYYPENPPTVASQISAQLPAAWSGRHLLFVSTIAPWAADHPEANGVKLVFDLDGLHSTQVVEVLNDKPHHWHVLDVPLPQYVGTPTLTVTPLPRTAISFDSTLFGFLGVTQP
jgi:hypothetical protein